MWSWRVYVDGNVHARGPGSKRGDPEHWYATLLPGAHRLVLRDAETNEPSRKESNTLHFTVDKQSEILVDVVATGDTIRLQLPNSG